MWKMLRKVILVLLDDWTGVTTFALWLVALPIQLNVAMAVALLAVPLMALVLALLSFMILNLILQEILPRRILGRPVAVTDALFLVHVLVVLVLRRLKLQI
jgi:hypothetical protein